MARSKSDLEIQGIKIDSENEWNVAIALDRLGYEYEYQYIFGMAGVRGSQTIDFLVYTAPKPTPLFVHGAYWHTSSKGREEDLKMQTIKTSMRGQWADPVIIWGDDCDTPEEAQATLVERL